MQQEEEPPYICSICLEPVSSAVRLTSNQVYDRACIKKWLQTTPSCPLTGVLVPDNPLQLVHDATAQQQNFEWSLRVNKPLNVPDESEFFVISLAAPTPSDGLLVDHGGRWGAFKKVMQTACPFLYIILPTIVFFWTCVRYPGSYGAATLNASILGSTYPFANVGISYSTMPYLAFTSMLSYTGWCMLALNTCLQFALFILLKRRFEMADSFILCVPIVCTATGAVFAATLFPSRVLVNGDCLTSVLATLVLIARHINFSGRLHVKAAAVILFILSVLSFTSSHELASKIVACSLVIIAQEARHLQYNDRSLFISFLLVLIVASIIIICVISAISDFYLGESISFLGCQVYCSDSLEP
jgi:hypothetical protein